MRYCAVGWPGQATTLLVRAQLGPGAPARRESRGMKAEERHHLKQNEFAVTAAKVAGTMAANRDRVVMGGIALVVVAALVGGYFYWNKRTNDQASGMLGRAMATAQAQVVPAPTLPGATRPAGTYPTEQARDEGAIKAFQEVAAAYPSTSPALPRNTTPRPV